MTAIRLLIGAALLAAGQRLFWLFVGAIGFVAGVQLATRFFADMTSLNVLLVGLVAGLIGAALAVMLQHMAVAVAGFVAGGYIALAVLEMVGLNAGRLEWLVFVAGGLVGTLLLAATFDWALIVLSSLVGAAVIVQALDLSPVVSSLLLLGLTALGIAVQAGLFVRRNREARRRLTGSP